MPVSLDPLANRALEYMANAVGNGYDLSQMSDAAVAEDMVECTGDFSDCSLSELTQAVRRARMNAHHVL